MPIKPKRRYTRLSTADWDSITALYETGASTLKEIADKYSVSIGAIMNQARARSVSRRGTFPALATLSTASAAGTKLIASTASAHKTIRSATAAAECISATNDDVYADVLAIQHLLRLSIAALPLPTSASEAAATVRAADMAITCLDRCNKVRRTVLRLDKDNGNADAILPELPITEMSDIEVQAMRAQQEREDRETGMGMEIDDDRLDAPDEEDEQDIVTIE